MIGFAAERLMELEVGVRAGAACGEKDPERKAQRNGYRERDCPLCQGRCRMDFKVNESQRWAMNRKEHDVSGRTKSCGHREDACAA
jgi:DNA replication protein DnaC